MRSLKNHQELFYKISNKILRLLYKINLLNSEICNIMEFIFAIESSFFPKKLLKYARSFECVTQLFKTLWENTWRIFKRIRFLLCWWWFKHNLITKCIFKQFFYSKQFMKFIWEYMKWFPSGWHTFNQFRILKLNFFRLYFNFSNKFFKFRLPIFSVFICQYTQRSKLSINSSNEFYHTIPELASYIPFWDAFKFL